MRLDRRRFLRGLVGTAAGVLVAPEVLSEPDRRVFALDRTMVSRSPELFCYPVPEWITKFEPHDTPLLSMIIADRDYSYWGWGEVDHPKLVQIGTEIMQVAGEPYPHPTSAHTVIPVLRGRRPHVLGD